tara:strand:+ start:15 stop:272 length:258 start_codon:yes stop_codon:yes gene_type:complete
MSVPLYILVAAPTTQRRYNMQLRILNASGHTPIEVTSEEIIDYISDYPTHWVCVDGTIVSRQNLSDYDWDGVETVDLMPSLVGGY